jgi:phosphopantetheinyl transferase (holo-ACP synthase)
MKEIEILSDDNSAPQVRLHGEALKLATEKGVSKVHISLSHSEVSFPVFLEHASTVMFLHLQTVAIAFAQATSA